MRDIADHRDTTPASASLVIAAIDDDCPSNLSHHYEIGGFDTSTNEAAKAALAGCESKVALFFQNGPVQRDTPNGVTEASLLAVVLDRLRSHQSGPYPCRENALAITKIEEALMWIGARTADRKRRGVEGSNAK